MEPRSHCFKTYVSGTSIQAAIASGNGMSLLKDFARHAPSVVAGAALYILGPRGPQYLLGIIAGTVVFAYVTMFVTGTSLEEAQDMSFFWKKEEVMISEKACERKGPISHFFRRLSLSVWLDDSLHTGTKVMQ